MNIALQRARAEQVVNYGKDEINTDVEEQYHEKKRRPGQGEQPMITGDSAQPWRARLDHVERSVSIEQAEPRLIRDHRAKPQVAAFLLREISIALLCHGHLANSG